MGGGRIIGGTGGVIVCILVGVWIWNVALPNTITKTRLERAARMAKVADYADGYMCEDIDWWKNHILISRVTNEERTLILYTAISAGRDGEFGSDDDLMVATTNWNNAKLLGKWMGGRALQFLKGVSSGIQAQSRHEKQ